MPRCLRKEYPGAKYHVTARGNGRAAIFLGPDDYSRFVAQLAGALRKDSVTLYAYVILPNHYHLFIETRQPNLHAFMQRLNTAYSLYWRYKHQKPGHVFQGWYGAKLVFGDEYILALTRYIHLNPVKGDRGEDGSPSERRHRLACYAWSSYQAYVGAREDILPVNVRWLMLMGGRTLQANRRRYRTYVETMISRDDEDLQDALRASPYAVGRGSSTDDTHRQLLLQQTGNRHNPDIVWPQIQHVSLARINAAVCSACGLQDERLLRAHGNAVGEAKAIALELACTLGGLNQRAAGRQYGNITGAAVGQQRKRLDDTMAKNPRLAQRVRQLTAALNV